MALAAVTFRSQAIMTKIKLTILIIDDNVNFVSRMISLLNEADDICTIYTAHNYDEASALPDKEPDLALPDIQLPGKRGIDILKHIKKSAKDCEVIMLSNYAGEYYRELCKKPGQVFFR
jgi:DNA-binding NarL/FixJ family response regulator